jgi:hypothetical protein
MTAPPNFAKEQLARVGLRAWLLLHGITSAVFWTLFFIAWTLLAHAGLAWVGGVALAAYIIVALPFLILQIVMVADLLAFAVIGQTFAYGTIDRLATEYAKANPEKVKTVSISLQLLFFLADASPLSSIALWGFVVLKRAPAGIHAKVPVLELKRQEIAVERAVYANAAERFRFAFAA